MVPADSFRDLIDAVPHPSRKLAVYAAEPSADAIQDIASFFDVPADSVTVHHPAASKPEVVLTAGGEALLTGSIADLQKAVTTTAELLRTDPTGEADPGSLIERIGTSTFRSGSVRQLLVASRYVERRAEREGEGTLYACFQHLSRVEQDLRTMLYYSVLGDTDLDVHVFGVPDTDLLDSDGLAVHEASAGELAKTWLVAYDGDGDDNAKAALVAEETAPRQYRGFWTQEPARADDAIDYLTETYLD